MKAKIFILCVILSFRTDVFSCGNITIGKDNFKNTVFSIGICPLAWRTTLHSEGDTWKGLLLGYTRRENDHLSVLYIDGGNEFAFQYFNGLGPEFSLNGQKELGLKTVFSINLAIIPMSLSLIPAYHFDAHKICLSVQAEIGLGFLYPIFFRDLKNRIKG